MRNLLSTVHRHLPALLLRGICFALLVDGMGTTGWASPGDAAVPSPVLQSLGKLPLNFEPNVGQFDAGISFYVRGAGCSIALGPTEATLVIPQKNREENLSTTRRSHHDRRRKAPVAAPSRLVKLELVGADRSAQSEGEAQSPGIINYLLGNDPAQWKTGINTFERARFRRVYPGIDLVYYGNQSQLEYDFMVAPHANPRLIKLRFTGADEMTVDASGDLLLHLGEKQLRWAKPVAYQNIDGERREVPASYRLHPGQRVEFELGTYDESQELVIDPVLIYTTYLGGTDVDACMSMAVDNLGNIYLAGYTSSTNFPVFKAYRTNAYGNADAYVTKLNSNATALVFSTYLGGVSNDWANAVAVDSGSNVYVAGYTESPAFPLRNSAQGYQDFGDIFLTKLGPLGTNLLYSTCYGGATGYEEAFGLAVNNSGNAYIVGQSYSGTTGNGRFPEQNSLPSGNSGNGLYGDAFISRFDTTQSGGNSVVYSTLLGGDDDDYAFDVSLDVSNNVYVCGVVSCADIFSGCVNNFPVQNALKSSMAGASEAFVCKLGSGTSASKIYCTLLGGALEDIAYGIAADSSGNAYITGETGSADFPVVNGYQTSLGGQDTTDAFVSKISANGGALLYSTYFGGAENNDGGRAIRTDRFGHVYVVGYTTALDLPVTSGAPQPTRGRPGAGSDIDLFVAKLNPLAPGKGGLAFSTYFGGSEIEALFSYGLFAYPPGMGLAVDTNLNFYIASDTASTNLPAAGGATYRTNAIGQNDVFAAKFSSPMDVSVSMFVSTNSPIVGSNFTYTIYANNNGPDSFTNLTVTDVLPAALQYVSGTNHVGSISNFGNTVTLRFNTFTNNAVGLATIIVKALQPGDVTNKITLSATPVDLNTNNNQASLVSDVSGVANLGLSLIAIPNPVLASSNITYVLTVTNIGPWPANGIVLTNPLPTGASYVSSVASQGPTAFAAGLTYAFIGTLNSNGVARVTNVYETGPLAGPITNSAGVYQDELDPIAANNNASLVATVNALTDAIIGGSTNSFAGPNLYLSSNLVYRVFVTNNGPSAATSVFVTNVISPGAAYVSATATRGSVTQFLGVVTWNVTSLTSNQSANLSITMRPTAVGLLTNSSVIASSSADPILGNNASSAVSLVHPAADIALTLVPPPNPTVVTSNLVYALTITNRGPGFATNIVLTGVVPTNNIFVVATSASQGSVGISGGILTANLGLLNPATAATVNLTLKPMLEGVVTNTFTLTHGVFDPVPNNASATVITVITNHPSGPILRINKAGTNVVLYWTTNSAGYFLKFQAGELDSGWSSVTNAPVVRGTQFFVTNSIIFNPAIIRYPGGYYRLERIPSLPALIILKQANNTNVTLSWPNNFASYSLQRSFEFQASNVWVTITNNPTLQGGRYYMTQSLSSPQIFYRLNPP